MVAVKYWSSESMTADILTKPLSVSKQKEFSEIMNLSEVSTNIEEKCIKGNKFTFFSCGETNFR